MKAQHDKTLASNVVKDPCLSRTSSRSSSARIQAREHGCARRQGPGRQCPHGPAPFAHQNTRAPRGFHYRDIEAHDDKLWPQCRQGLWPFAHYEAGRASQGFGYGDMQAHGGKTLAFNSVNDPYLSLTGAQMDPQALFGRSVPGRIQEKFAVKLGRRLQTSRCRPQGATRHRWIPKPSLDVRPPDVSRRSLR